MKFCRYILLILLALALVLPTVSVSAAQSPESKDWLFIDGVNITRQVECAVVYRNTDRTGQNRWGYDVVVDAENKVVQIVKSGEADEGGTLIPKGGWVISASGSKIKWLENNVSLGDSLYFDDYTRRLFVLDGSGNFNPYGSQTLDITEFGSGYMISEPENSDFKVDFVYAVTLDAQNRVIARGEKADIPENGTAIYATTAIARDNLIACAPVGSVCKINGSKATFTYSKSDLKRSLESALTNVTAQRDLAKESFADLDYDTLNAMIDEATALKNSPLDYQKAFSMMSRLESETEYLLTERYAVELRAAFHTPEETTNEEVRKTILSAKRSGLNTIILRVTNGYGTFIPLPEGNRFSQDAKFNSFDLLKSYTKNCKDEGISLILCFDVYYNEYAAVANSNWLSKSNDNDSNVANKFFSPQNSEFKEYYLDYIQYVITNYDVDSVMFDSLRYPKFQEKGDLGYDDATMRAFSEKYDIPLNDVKAIKTQLFTSPHWEQWKEYRQGLVTEMAAAISQTVRSARSDMNLFFVAERDTVDYYYHQSSVEWISDKLFDGVLVAVYDRVKDENDTIGANAYYGSIISEKCGVFPAFTGEDNFLFAGIESSNGMSADLIGSAINDARSIDTDGFVLSSLTDFIPHSTQVNLKSASAVSPISELQGSVQKILDSAWLRIYNVIYKSEGCDYDTMNSAEIRINGASSQLESDEFTYQHAKELESDIAVIFATSVAKSEALRDFSALSKMAKLSKTKVYEDEPQQPTESTPEIDDSDADVSQPQEESESYSAEETTSALSQIIIEEKSTVDFGVVLIYGFVGFAFLSAVAAVVVSIRRKKATPSNRHMPKGSAKGYEDKQ